MPAVVDGLLGRRRDRQRGRGRDLPRVLAGGGDPALHAEESALGKLAADDPRLAGATTYSTLEPCSERKSRPRTCTQLIIAAGLRRVVIAWREPALFVLDGRGVELLAGAGLEVAELPALAGPAAAPNRHLSGYDQPDAGLAPPSVGATGYSYWWVNYAWSPGSGGRPHGDLADRSSKGH